MKRCGVVHPFYALYCRYAPEAQYIYLQRWFSCSSFPLVVDLPAKANEHHLPWFGRQGFPSPGLELITQLLIA